MKKEFEEKEEKMKAIRKEFFKMLDDYHLSLRDVQKIIEINQKYEETFEEVMEAWNKMKGGK